MARRAARRGPEFEQRLEARRRFVRLSDIWAAIVKADDVDRLPHHIKIRVKPRVRGCGHAAKKAGFAT
jgi:hypothetical protein